MEQLFVFIEGDYYKYDDIFNAKIKLEASKRQSKRLWNTNALSG